MDKKKILIIDDEEDFTKLVKMNLEGTGEYEVRTENKGKFGLAVAKEFKPDLILLDVMMPGKDGCEVRYELKNEQETKDIPVVFLTAVVSSKDTEKNNGLIGGNLFIAKPVDIKKLIEVIKKNIR
jgi:CheY-like chemotaxis protein